LRSCVAGWHIRSVHLALTGAAGLLAYKLIKRHAVRERPFITHPAINCARLRSTATASRPPHAARGSFAILGAHYLPGLAAPLAAFAFLVALSRVVLGLHYPTDVAAGALLGGGFAFASLRSWRPSRCDDAQPACPHDLGRLLPARQRRLDFYTDFRRDLKRWAARVSSSRRNIPGNGWTSPASSACDHAISHSTRRTVSSSRARSMTPCARWNGF
jgi:undecaprenyl-diphosphatase